MNNQILGFIGGSGLYDLEFLEEFASDELIYYINIITKCRFFWYYCARI